MARLTLDWLHVIVLLGAIQGAFLAGALATKQRNRTANRLLAAAMLAFSIGMATSVYHAAGLVEAAPHFFGLAYPLPFLYGPLIYMYGVTAADRNRRLTWRDALHLVPFLATVIFGLPIYLMSGAEKVAFSQQLESGTGNPPLLIAIADPLKFVSGVAYTTLTLVFLRRHRRLVRESYSSTERVNLRWLLWLGAAAALIWALAVGLQLVESAGIARIDRADDFVSLAVAVLVYGIGYMGLRQPEIFRYQTAEFPVVRPHPVSESVNEKVDVKVVANADEVAAGPRYERSGLGDREAQRLKNALVQLMDKECPWKDSELTLGDLAARLGTSPHKLSEVLNAEVGQTFYDFVNGYRVREVQRRIAAGDGRSLKMLSLALDAGFASKSTFNEVFKKLTGQTPSDFRQGAGV